MRKSILIVTLVLIAAMPVTAESGFGVGILAGGQVLNYPLLENLEGWNNDSPLAFYGLYGYAVDERGFIAGGFGSVIDDRGGAATGGAVGGFILGKQLLSAPVNLSLTSWTGFGPVSTNWGAGGFSTEGGAGYIVILEEFAIELGVPLFHWFMPTAYVGLQIAGNVFEWNNFNGFAAYSAVIGFRLQFGEYNHGIFDKE